MAVLLLFLLPQGHAGDLLTPERLVQEADLLIVASVAISQHGVEVELDEVLYATAVVAAAIRNPDSQLAFASGPCLPDRGLLAAWLARSVGTLAARAAWQRALNEQGYRAVLALRHTTAGLLPLCETETLQAEHWIGHPDHIDWRHRLNVALVLAGDKPVSRHETRPAAASGERTDCPTLD